MTQSKLRVPALPQCPNRPSRVPMSIVLARLAVWMEIAGRANAVAGTAPDPDPNRVYFAPVALRKLERMGLIWKNG